MFFFKKTEIVVDCFTYHHSVYENYKPEKASEFIPDEWKTLPKTVTLNAFSNRPSSKLTIPSATAKTCVGFINLFKSGFIIQNWADQSIEVTVDGELNASSPAQISNISQHDPWQVWDTFYAGCGHVKLNTPWAFKEKTGVKFVFGKCTWNDTHMTGNFHVLTGIVDYKNQNSTQINFYAKKDSIVELRAGQPLAHIIPMSENKLKLKYHLVTHEEYVNRFLFAPTNVKLYSEFERTNNSNQAKCPFGFGK
jgi:hypothetical protein